MKNNLYFPFLTFTLPKMVWEGEPAPASDPVSTPDPAPAPAGGEPAPTDPLAGDPAPTDPPAEDPVDPPAPSLIDTPEDKIFAEPLTDLSEMLPEGVTPTEEQSAALLETLNGATTPQELVSSLMELHQTELTRVAEEMAAVFEQTNSDWVAAVKASPEYGGDNLDQSLAIAKQVGMKYGGQEFIDLLNLTGAGNNLAMVSFLNSVHKALPQEATPISGAPTQPEKSLADKMFGG